MDVELLNMDCRDYMEMFCGKESIDLVVTSPPYDNLRTYNNSSTWNWSVFTDIAAGLWDVIKVGGVIVWVVGDATIKGSETGSSFKQALHFKEIGFNLHDTMIYEKQNKGACGNNKGYWQTFEYMFILSKGKIGTINLIMDRENAGIRKPGINTKRTGKGVMIKEQHKGHGKFGRRTNVWKYITGNNQSTKDRIAFEHPAIFPEQLASDHIISWSNPGDLVFDPFMGSGTTGKMAILNGRNFVGTEIDEKYFKIAQERLKTTKD